MQFCFLLSSSIPDCSEGAIEKAAKSPTNVACWGRKSGEDQASTSVPRRKGNIKNEPVRGRGLPTIAFLVLNGRLVEFARENK